VQRSIEQTTAAVTQRYIKYKVMFTDV